MASTSAAEPSSALEETRNWLEMPHEIMGGMILQRLGAVEILNRAQKVCTTWRRICKDPAMWKVIRINHHLQPCDKDYFIKELIKQAVNRSRGELIDIGLKWFATDDLLDFISRSSSKLNHLRLTNCSDITGRGLNNALKKLPHLETLKLSYIDICAEDIEVIGHNCPQLKSFTLKTEFMDCDGDVHAIANSMPALRHLKLVGSSMADDDDEVKAILNGCPHLESLDLRECYYLHLDENLEKVCRERIKDFKFKRNNIPEGDEESDMEMFDYNDDINNDLYDDGRGMDYDAMVDYGFSNGNAISSEDDDEIYYSPISSGDDCGCSCLYSP